MSASRRDRGVLSNRFGTKPRRRTRRQYALEPLESRVVLSYTFSYNPVTQVATATGSTVGATDSLVLEPLGGFLLWSQNGSTPFNGTWDTSSVPLSPTLTVDVTLSNGDGSSLQLGTATGPASQLLGDLVVVAPVNTADTTLIDDSTGTTLASGIHPYSIDTSPGFISGPGFSYDQSGSAAFKGGVTLEGSAVNGNIYDVLSTGPIPGGPEPINVITGAGTTSTVNVGDGGTLSGLQSPVAIYGASASSATTLDVNDASDTTHSQFFFDSPSGNPSAAYQVTGDNLAVGPVIQYGPGVTAFNFNGGTFGGAGVDYQLDQTQPGTTTTINAGPNQNFYYVAGSTAILDGNLLGPVVINGGAQVTSFKCQTSVAPTMITTRSPARRSPARAASLV